MGYITTYKLHPYATGWTVTLFQAPGGPVPQPESTVWVPSLDRAKLDRATLSSPALEWIAFSPAELGDATRGAGTAARPAAKTVRPPKEGEGEGPWNKAGVPWVPCGWPLKAKIPFFSFDVILFSRKFQQRSEPHLRIVSWKWSVSRSVDHRNDRTELYTALYDVRDLSILLPKMDF